MKQLRMIASGFAVALFCGHVARVSAEPADATSRPFTLTVHSPCAGEVIAITGTVHLVNRPGNALPEHASWSSTGTGLTTGTVYRVVSASNLLIDSDDYLTHLTIKSF